MSLVVHVLHTVMHAVWPARVSLLLGSVQVGQEPRRIRCNQNMYIALSSCDSASREKGGMDIGGVYTGSLLAHNMSRGPYKCLMTIVNSYLYITLP